MNNHEACRLLIKEEGRCSDVPCASCPGNEGDCAEWWSSDECASQPDAQTVVSAKKWLKNHSCTACGTAIRDEEAAYYGVRVCANCGDNTPRLLLTITAGPNDLGRMVDGVWIPNPAVQALQARIIELEEEIYANKKLEDADAL